MLALFWLLQYIVLAQLDSFFLQDDPKKLLMC